MRILFIVTAFPRHPGDVITPWLEELIARLRPVGVDVEVLAPSYRGSPDHDHNGIRVHRFRYAPRPLESLTHDQTAPDRIRERPWWVLALPGYFLGGVRAARALLRNGQFDVVHAFWPLPHGAMAAAAIWGSNVPLVSTFFGVELTLARRTSALRALLRTILRRSAAVTAISSYTATQLQRLAPGTRVDVLPFGAAFEPEPRERDGLEDLEKFEVLFVGRLVERKGVDTLLDALLTIPEVDAHLSVVGDGPERVRLEALARQLPDESVHFHGFVGESDLSDRMATADVLVLPARTDAKGDVEGLGVVLIEALLHGTPVIASQSGGIPDIVQDGVTGLLVPPGDPVALGDAIRRMANDPGLRRRLAESGRQHVTQQFSWNRIVEDLSDIYRRVAPGETRRPEQI